MADCKVMRSEIEESPVGSPVGGESRAHAAECRACGDSMRARDALGGLVRGLERVEAPSDFEFRLRARIAEHKDGRGRAVFARLGALPLYATAAAALCLVVVAASLYFWQQRRAPVEARSSVVKVESPVREVSPQETVASAPTPAAKPAVIKETGALMAASGDRLLRKRNVVPQRARGATRAEQAARSFDNNFSVKPAPVISRLRIPVNTTAEPLRVVLRDASGAARVVPMRAVSFGSQELLAREGAARRVSVSRDEGVW